MKHKIICSCGAEMNVFLAGNSDTSLWSKKAKRWTKIRRPSEYRILARCKKNTCLEVRKLSGRSKAEVMRSLNRENKKQRIAA